MPKLYDNSKYRNHDCTQIYFGNKERESLECPKTFLI